MRVISAIAALALGAASTAALSAHRLDEYLQASRLSIGLECIDVDIDLTAGASMADAVFSRIDADRSGTISADESRQYASSVLGSTTLTLDGHPLSLALTNARAPRLADMREGVGIFHLTATAAVPPLTRGNHEIFFRNAHQPQASVYLVNPLVPSTSSISIGGQRRDVQQRELTVSFRVNRGGIVSTSAASGLLVAAVAVLPATLIWQRRRTRRDRASSRQPDSDSEIFDSEIAK